MARVEKRPVLEYEYKLELDSREMKSLLLALMSVVPNKQVADILDQFSDQWIEDLMGEYFLEKANREPVIPEVK